MNGVRRARWAAVAASLAVLAGACGSAPGPVARPAVTPTPATSTPTASTPTASPTSPSPRPHPVTVRWPGPVEGIFVHPLILDPRLAFAGDSLGHGFWNYFVTAREFRVLLDQLWRNGWTLVDAHRAAAGTVRVPRGRKPLVLIEDDANYYRYFDGRGLARRLVLAGSQVRAQLDDGSLTDQDVIPMVDAEVRRHPAFSADGAKGVLALTGFEGLFGERDPAQPAAHKRLLALAERLRQTGWSFASHTNGHIDLSTSSLSRILADDARWRALARPILGPVDMLVYPFGARPSVANVAALARAGYRIQFDIDIVARRVHIGGAIVMSRRHVDGIAFESPARQRPFYDVAAVWDPRRPRL